MRVAGGPAKRLDLAHSFGERGLLFYIFLPDPVICRYVAAAILFGL